jgi:hypothetical protein
LARARDFISENDNFMAMAAHTTGCRCRTRTDEPGRRGPIVGFACLTGQTSGTLIASRDGQRPRSSTQRGNQVSSQTYRQQFVRIATGRTYRRQSGRTALMDGRFIRFIIASGKNQYASSAAAAAAAAAAAEFVVYSRLGARCSLAIRRHPHRPS